MSQKSLSFGSKYYFFINADVALNRCAQPCEVGRFGANCRLTCTCVDGECDPVTGVCNNNYVQRTTFPTIVVTEVNWPMNGMHHPNL